MKYLTVLIIFLYSQASWSIFIGNELPSEAPEYQCQLMKYDLKLKKNLSVCSGTYLNENIFLTAAHCFNILSYGHKFGDGVHYYVSCKNSINKVQAVAVHPYYKVDRVKTVNFDPENLNKPSRIETGFNFSLPYNDIALVYTDKVNFQAYPTLNNNPKADYKESSCRSLGFSPHNCNSLTGEGCYKSNVSIEKSKPEVKIFRCDLVTSESCFSSNSEKDSLPYYYTSKSQKFAKGDSGSGLLCTDRQSKEEVLAGIRVSESAGKEFISVANKYNFINHFLNLSFDEFKQQASTISFDSRIEESEIISRKIERHFLYKVKVEIKISSHNIDTTHILLSDLYAEFKSEDSGIKDHFQSQKVNKIIIDKYPFSKIIDTKVLIEKYGSVTELVIHPGSSIEDIREFLSKNKIKY